MSKIYEAVAELEASYPGRKFTPDGHLVGSIGEVIAAQALTLTLHPASHPDHDAYDINGEVQIKMIGPAGKRIALYGNCQRLVVLRIVSPAEAEIVYDGPGDPIWKAAGKPEKNGQRVIGINRVLAIRDNQDSN